MAARRACYPRWFGDRRHSCKAASRLVAAFVQHWGEGGLPARADAVIEYPFAAMHESLIGTYGTCRATLTMSVVRGKVDLALGRIEV